MEDKKPIGYKCTCNFGGIEILDIIFDIENVIIFRENYNGEPSKIITRNIKTTPSGREYFNYKGNREYLDQYMRI